MVKNLPSVERSTKIRFGKHVPDSTDQEENTIVFNASNTLVPTPYSNAVYLSPIRNRTDYEAPEIVLLMYDRNTKEITESGESANALIGGSTLNTVVDRANATSNTVQFIGALNGVGFVTDSNIGISNVLPQHTVSVGSNLYIDDFGSNVLVVSGNVAVLRDMIVEGNLTVNGDTTVIYTENISIKDAIVELGKDNTSGDTTLDLGLLMHRPDALSNVVIGYREGTDEFAIAYTDSKPTDKTLIPKTDEDINVHVYGLTHIDANIYGHEDLLVAGNVYVSQNVSVTKELTVSGNVYADKDLEVTGNVYTDGNVVTYKDLLVSGNVYVSQNVSVTKELTISGNVYADKDLEVVGNTYIDGNVVAYKDLLVTGNIYTTGNTNVTSSLNVTGNVYANKDLEVVGNVYTDGNVVAYKDLLVTGNVYTTGNTNVTSSFNVSGNVYAKKDLLVTGNVYTTGNTNVTSSLNVSGNVYAKKDLLVTGNVYTTGNTNVTSSLNVNGNVYAKKDLLVTGNAYTTGNIYANKNLIVAGNVLTTGNTSISGVLNLTNTTTALKTNLTSNVHVKLDQLSNVVIGQKVLANEDMLVYDGSNWTNQLQNHTFLYAKAAAALSKGEVVYATGAVGNETFVVDKADARYPTKMPAIGIVYQDLALNGQGLIVTFGRADGIPIPGAIEGETVYVSNTVPGGLSNVAPTGIYNGAPNLIQNIGIVVKPHASQGVVSVTGVGRVNAIPNANVITSTPAYVYTDGSAGRNTMNKIDPVNLLTKLQTLQQVVNTGNTVANTINVTGLTTTGNVNITSNISVVGLADPNNKYLPMVDTNGYFVKSPVYVTNEGKYVISASEAEFLGNITLGGNTTIISSTSITISDRIFGVGANNSATGLDSGFIIEHQDLGTFANIALIHHADEHRFSVGYTQNTFTDNHILHHQHDDGTLLRIDLLGNALVQNSLTVNETSIFDGRVGIKTASPGFDLDVRGTANVGALTATTGTFTGDVSGVAGDFSGAVSGTTGTFTGDVSGVAGDFSGAVSGTTGTFTGAVSGTTGTFTGAVSGTTGTFTGDLEVDTNVLKVDATLDRVGINTATPTGELHVVGNAFVTSNITTSSNVIVTGTAAATSKTTGAVQVTGGVGISGNVYADAAYISSNLNVDGTTLHVDSVSNRVGVGKTDPGFTLDVTGDVNFSGGLYQGGSLFVSTPWTIETSPDALSYTAGNVGIGVVNPSSTLEVDGNVSAYEIIVSNVTTTNLIMNTVTVNALQSLENVVNVSNVTSNTVQFTNTDTSLVALGNVVVSGNVIAASLTTTGNITTTGNVIAASLTTTANVLVSGHVTQTAVPAFTARLTDGSIVGAGVIDYNSVLTDNTSSYTAANGRFTAPINGHYFFSASGVWQNDNTIYDFTINDVRQNINSLCSSPLANYIQCNITGVLYLTAGQYVNVYQVEGGTFGTDNNVFTGFLIG
jgi:cytoskeletal protein CcmA (bactofilin family)